MHVCLALLHVFLGQEANVTTLRSPCRRKSVCSTVVCLSVTLGTLRKGQNFLTVFCTIA